MGRDAGFDEFEGMFDGGEADVLSLLDASAARPASEAFAATSKATSAMPARVVEEAERMAGYMAVPRGAVINMRLVDEAREARRERAMA